MNYILNRLAEHSTWQGPVALLGVFGRLEKFRFWLSVVRLFGTSGALV